MIDVEMTVMPGPVVLVHEDMEPDRMEWTITQEMVMAVALIRDGIVIIPGTEHPVVTVGVPPHAPAAKHPSAGRKHDPKANSGVVDHDNIVPIHIVIIAGRIPGSKTY